jgi:ubiquinone/menaquinone biosynthesis C-methylase UbiE
MLPAMSAFPSSPPGASIAFDRAAGFYDATRGFPPDVAERVAELFVAAGGLGAASRLLEVGIGTGRIALPLARHVGSYTGVDLAGPMIAQLVRKANAVQLGRVRPLRADAMRLPFANGVFDAAVGVHVFHLIPGWRGVLGELARVLRPEGLLLHGGDDHTRGEAWGSWRRRMEAGFGVENVGVPRERIQSFLAEEGWRPAGERQSLRFARMLRPRELVESVRGRLWSMCWRMSDAQVEQAAAALQAELAARFGDLDRPVELEAGFWVQAHRPPRA